MSVHTICPGSVEVQTMPRSAHESFGIEFVVAMTLIGLVGMAAVVFGVAAGHYAVAVIAGFAAAAGSAALVLREVHESVRS